MEEKKSFFANLEPKSAMIVGVVAGFLVLCAIGFVVMLVVYFGGKDNTDNNQKTPIVDDSQNTPVPVVVKSDKPVVELFVMAFCPFGLQMQKAFVPAWELLKDKADFSVKFVSYAMHGKEEIEENTRQYCIQAEQPEKYISYLKCFVVGKDKNGYKSCLTSAGVNEAKLNTCVNNANNKFGIMAKFDDQGSWLNGRYPIYSVHADLNEKYGVQGSPTLIINGAEVQANRTPAAVKQAVCAAFNNAPAECAQKLSTAAAVAGFGAGTGADTGTAACE